MLKKLLLVFVICISAICYMVVKDQKLKQLKVELKHAFDRFSAKEIVAASDEVLK